MGLSGTSVEPSVQKPSTGVALAEKPQATAIFGHDAVIVAFDVRSAPPAGLNPLGSQAIGDLVPGAVEMKTDWRPVRHQRGSGNLDGMQCQT